MTVVVRDKKERDRKIYYNARVMFTRSFGKWYLKVNNRKYKLCIESGMHLYLDAVDDKELKDIRILVKGQHGYIILTRPHSVCKLMNNEVSF